ncbi:FKBP12-associated protein [Malassezia cuniculi]|uniref:FKBP12-associated protein n=1 Tax=Malassezia cuniculi TaxID=948313 RepID=A0AAF0J6I0_9BASI|nr:FKBP12-associated protein [Malassezia cuniculi]
MGGAYADGGKLPAALPPDLTLVAAAAAAEVVGVGPPEAVDEDVAGDEAVRESHDSSLSESVPTADPAPNPDPVSNPERSSNPEPIPDPECIPAPAATPEPKPAPARNRNGASAKTNSRRNRQNFGAQLTAAAPETGAQTEHLDLRSRLEHELECGEYDCIICFNSVTRKNAVWSCSRCYAVFHLGCVRKWAEKSVAQIEEHNAMHEDEDIRTARGTWRCPGCQQLRSQWPEACKLSLAQVATSIGGGISCGATCGKLLALPGAAAMYAASSATVAFTRVSFRAMSALALDHVPMRLNATISRKSAGLAGDLHAIQQQLDPEAAASTVAALRATVERVPRV